MRHRIGNQELHGRILVMIFASSREIYIPKSASSEQGHTGSSCGVID
jgi:hypothetical protein